MGDRHHKAELYAEALDDLTTSRSEVAALKAENDRLRQALKDARYYAEEWGCGHPGQYKARHELYARIADALAATEPKEGSK